MMPEWHHSNFSRAIYALPESTKKKVLNQVPGPPKTRPNSAGLIFSLITLIAVNVKLIFASRIDTIKI